MRYCIGSSPRRAKNFCPRAYSLAAGRLSPRCTSSTGREHVSPGTTAISESPPRFRCGSLGWLAGCHRWRPWAIACIAMSRLRVSAAAGAPTTSACQAMRCFRGIAVDGPRRVRHGRRNCARRLMRHCRGYQARYGEPLGPDHVVRRDTLFDRRRGAFATEARVTPMGTLVVSAARCEDPAPSHQVSRRNISRANTPAHRTQSSRGTGRMNSATRIARRLVGDGQRVVTLLNGRRPDAP